MGAGRALIKGEIDLYFYQELREQYLTEVVLFSVLCPQKEEGPVFCPKSVES